MTNKKTTKTAQLTGKVVSDKMDKTRVVEIVETRQHPMYKKIYTRTVKIKAHDEKNEYHYGDEVLIQETRRLSHDKAWLIVRKVK